jgi:hypothetical protein
MHQEIHECYDVMLHCISYGELKIDVYSIKYKMYINI